MKHQIYTLSLFIALATVPSVAFGQFDRLKKMKEKVVEKADKPTEKSQEKKSEPPKEEETARAEDKPAAAPAARKEESAPAPSGPPPAEYFPNGDVKVLYGAGNDDREREYISASPASSSIFNFRQAMVTLIDQTKANDKNHMDATTDEMVKYFKEVKEKDPNYDTKKYEATVQRYAKASEDRQKAEKEKKENGDKDAMDATNGTIARKIKEMSPGKYYYSALISQNKKNAYFVDVSSPDYKYIVNAVLYSGDKSRRVKYFEFSKTDAQFAHSLNDNDLTGSHGAKGVLVEDQENKKTEECFCDMYSVQVGFEGIVAEKDGSITVFHAPLKAGKKDYDFDLDKIDVDVLNKDLNAAKAVNLEEKKKEAIAYINKTLKKKDAADAGDKTKRVSEKRRTPVGLAAAIPVATMKDELGKMLASKPVYGTNMQRNSADCSYTVTTAYVIDRDWAIDRNALGVILGRKIATEAVEKGSNGKCYLRRYCFYEQNQGGDKYGAPFIEYEIFWGDTRDDGEAICDNIK